MHVWSAESVIKPDLKIIGEIVLYFGSTALALALLSG